MTKLFQPEICISCSQLRAELAEKLRFFSARFLIKFEGEKKYLKV